MSKMMDKSILLPMTSEQLDKWVKAASLLGYVSRCEFIRHTVDERARRAIRAAGKLKAGKKRKRGA